MQNTFATELYRCQEGRHITFQQFPCSDNELQNEIDTDVLSKYTTNTMLESGDDSKDKSKDSSSDDTASKTITLTRAADSHFYIDALVNGVKVHFLIDTGATFVLIPTAVAGSARLNKGNPKIFNTANGYVQNFETQIRDFRIMGVRFKDLEAFIGETDTQPLLGMNVLEKFKLDQNKDTLTISIK